CSDWPRMNANQRGRYRILLRHSHSSGAAHRRVRSSMILRIGVRCGTGELRREINPAECRCMVLRSCETRIRLVAAARASTSGSLIACGMNPCKKVYVAVRRHLPGRRRTEQNDAVRLCDAQDAPDNLVGQLFIDAHRLYHMAHRSQFRVVQHATTPPRASGAGGCWSDFPEEPASA